jgi:predicted small integral membrane protein
VQIIFVKAQKSKNMAAKVMGVILLQVCGVIFVLIGGVQILIERRLIAKACLESLFGAAVFVTAVLLGNRVRNQLKQMEDAERQEETF